MKWTYILLAYISLIGLGLADNIRGPVYPEVLEQFNLSNAAGSLFFSLGSMAGVLNNLFANWWLNRWGVMGSLRRYLVLLGASCLTLGFASHIEVVWLGVAMMGASFGGLAIAQNLLVVHGSTPRRRTQALSGLHTMYGLASLLAPITVSISYLFAWKWNSMFLFAASIPFAVLIWSLREKSSPQLNLIHETDNELPRKLGLKPLIWVATFTSFYVMTEILISSRVVLYVRTIEDYTPKQANDLLGGFFIAMLVGRLYMTVVPTRVKNSTLLRSSFAAATVTMGLAILVDPLWFVASGLAMSVSFPCMVAYASETFGAHTARVMAWIFTGNYVGLIGMHALVGVVADHFGLRLALLLGPIFLVLAFILLSIKPLLPSSETAVFPR